MYVRFQTDKKRLNGLLSSGKNYSITEADTKLKELCALPETKQKNIFYIEIYEDKKNRIFRSDFEAGEDQTNNIILLIEQLLEANFPDESPEEKRELLQKINHALKEERTPTKQIEIESYEGIKRQPKEKKENQPIQWPVSKQGFFLLLKRAKLPIVVSLLLLTIGSLSFIWLNGSTSTADQSDSYEMLLKKREYLEAYEQYPEKEGVLVETLYIDKNREVLEELSSKEKSKLADFYLNFLEENWEKVTSMKDVKLNETVQAMRGYAYLKQEKVTEAEIINKEIQNETLTEQINTQKKVEAYQLLKKKDVEAAEKINSTIKDTELTEDIKVTKSIVNLLNKYQSDRNNKELSDSERKEADENYKMWEENLKQLGGIENE
ncbi:hypothetical protein [Enterococcus gilvus]|uniref:Uncharacterized protein n=1 Tax=Enterococcus gilvus ATCC BAA-350 TaxID=1158614 RepID=R2X9P1_9ENTE|nr:hypothetical protein [Enterococcus gilvus]EOI51509.1 hypothetical protein UKC_04184 [Enterococcus gilvus ATCC BAA-350]EOW77180.1 hypothetical protein I592_04156 [Enterococcus gilvus ATCC BAA-350]OJG41157.1 hypothetical protein RV02_GL001244 [Enterococcus gilvus]